MADLNIEGMAIAPGVVETIVSLAAREVEGVAAVGDPATNGIRTLIGGSKAATQGVEVEMGEDDALKVSIRIAVKNGSVLPDVAADVRRSVADAVNTQVGAAVAAVDVFVDAIQFED